MNAGAADQKALRDAIRQCHADPAFRARFVTECRKQISDEKGTDDRMRDVNRIIERIERTVTRNLDRKPAARPKARPDLRDERNARREYTWRAPDARPHVVATTERSK
jgi:hypothetical protein